MRVIIAPGIFASRYTGSPELTIARERVVGIPKLYIASLTIYSLRMGPNHARPSPPREYGVLPEPLRAISYLSPSGDITSVNKCARPSPRSGLNCPN